MQRLGLEEGVLVVFYAAGLVALILRYRSVLLDSDILLWAVGALLFVMSVLVDGFVKDSTAFVRGNYIKVLESYTSSRDKARVKPGGR